MKKYQTIDSVIILLVLLGATIFFSSWQESTELTLSKAGKNKQELERILSHFEKDPDSLKIRAAEFLISRMQYYYSSDIQSDDNVRKLYSIAGRLPIEKRNQVFQGQQVKTTFSLLDLYNVHTDYIINHIEKSVKRWRDSKWSKDYDIDYFYNYVLPYRISNEPLSAWLDSISYYYPYLDSEIVYSNKGVRLSSSNAKSERTIVLSEPSTLNGKALLLNNKGSVVTYSIESKIECTKKIKLRYSTDFEDAIATISVNGKYISSNMLEPTLSSHHYRSDRYGNTIHLKKGRNTLSIGYCNRPFILDYIELGSVCSLTSNDLRNLSSGVYTISNAKTGSYVSLDNEIPEHSTKVFLCNRDSADISSRLDIEYQGNSCWKFSPETNTDLCMENQWVSLEPGNFVSLYSFLKRNYQKWVIIPYNKEFCKIMNKDSGLFWEVSTDSDTGKEVIIQNMESADKAQLWRIKKVEDRKDPNNIFGFNTALSEALKVFDIMPQFEYTSNTGSIPPSISELCKYKYGTCREEASYTVALSRFLGIPTTIDFTPHWGNRTGSHNWSVLIFPNGKGTPFYMGCVPGDTAQYFHSYIKPKVFRSIFGINKEIARDLQNENSLPKLFRNPKFIDVTDEYCATSDISLSVPEQYRNKSIIYICVFDTKTVVPVFYGLVNNGVVNYRKMGRGIAYIMAIQDNGILETIGNPFILTNEGMIREINCDYEKKESVTLLRKYPFFGAQDYFNLRMNYGKFQGCNTADFTTPKDLYQHQGATNGGWYEKTITDTCAYRYLRYIGPKGSYCNINELEFYDNEGQKITGNIIGTTPGNSWQELKAAFDGNILTGFGGNSPDGHWVGLELEVPQRVCKIRYMPRTDGNCIEIGDEYQLNVFDHGQWCPVWRGRATKTELNLQNIPSKGLYLLNDLTKGREERIFTYDNQKQIWW
ncbi:hypothetical protein [uncultured Prevotella sp.]|uniref:hypothetical protein n=1 Tax=uncultured Prevotella sp. TaxID=159272 RepID=UPI00258E45AB|nr:hypothetical protein [uncultured Prevotella sp.]